MYNKRPLLLLLLSLFGLLLTNANLARASTPTVTLTPSPSMSATATFSSTFTPSPSCSSTTTQTPTCTHTVTHTVTPTPVVNVWVEDFNGTYLQQPANWEDETEENTFNAEIYYAPSGTEARLVRTSENTWGKTLSKNLNINVDYFPMVEIKVNSITAGSKWGLGIQGRTGNHDYWNIQADTSYVGVTRYAYADAMSADGVAGEQTFSIEVRIGGSENKYVDIDYIRIFRETYDPLPSISPTPTPTPDGSWELIGVNLNQDDTKDVNFCEVEAFKDTPYVVWTEEQEANIYDLYVKKYNASTGQWVLLLHKASTTGHEYKLPRLATDQSNIYSSYVIHDDAQGFSNHLVVEKYDGAQWTELGEPWEVAGYPELAVAQSVPYAAWSVWDGNYHRVHVRRFQGGEWSDVGQAVNWATDHYQYELNPSMVVQGSTPYVAWDELTNEDALRLQHHYVYTSVFKNDQWQYVGKYLNINYENEAQRPRLALSASGAPFITWVEEGDGIGQIFVRFWDQEFKTWTRLGGSLNMSSSQKANIPHIAVVDETPYVVWKEWTEHGTEIFLKYWDGNQWLALGGSLNLDKSHAVNNPSITSGNGLIYVSWSETDENGIGQLMVKKYLVPAQSVPTPYIKKVKTFAYPNPFVPSHFSRVKFYFAAADRFDIHIIDLRGREVRCLKNERTWDGRDAQGRVVDGGVYIYQVHANGSWSSGTVVVIK